MRQFIAYFTNATIDAKFAKNCDFWLSRIKPGGPYFYTKYNYQGTDGVLAYQKTMLPDGSYDNQHPPIYTKDIGKPREVKREGDKFLIYFSPQEIPSQEYLARANIPNSSPVQLTSGIQISVPFAVSTPRLLDFAENTVLFDETANLFTKKVFQIAEMWKTDSGRTSITDADLIQLVGLAVKETYRATDDLLRDLAWIQTTDIYPIIYAIMGIDPKLQPAA